MWPIFLTLGSYELGTYGVLVGIGVLLSLWVARHLGTRDGLPPRNVNDVGLGTLFFGFLGAATLGVLVAWATGMPVSMADFRNSGAVHGGLLSAMPAAYLLARHFKLSFPALLDAYVPAVALGQAIGRLGCFAAGCCFGARTDVPWAVTYVEPRARQLGGVPLHVHLHPVQLYDAGAHLVLFLALFFLHKRGHFRGALFGVWCLAEGSLRFSLETFRGDLGRGLWFDLPWLSTGRITALLLATIGAVYLLRHRTVPAPDSRASR